MFYLSTMSVWLSCIEFHGRVMTGSWQDPLVERVNRTEWHTQICFRLRDIDPVLQLLNRTREYPMYIPWELYTIVDSGPTSESEQSRPLRGVIRNRQVIIQPHHKAVWTLHSLAERGSLPGWLT